MNCSLREVFRYAACLFLLVGALCSAHRARGVTVLHQEASLDSPAIVIPCTTCEGDGHVVLPCAYCAGKGKAECRECPIRLSGIPGSMRQAILLRDDPEKLEEEEQKLADAKESLAQLSQLFQGRFVNEQIPKGCIDCPGGCANGTIGTDKKYPCRYCKKKGFLKCPTCKKKGVAKCPFCIGRKRRDVTCPECRGSGTGTALSSYTVATAPICPWCNSKDLISCNSCDGKGKAPGFCANCSNVGTLFCRTCLGTEKKPCNRCRAAGKVTSLGLNGSHVVRCEGCKGSGILDCDNCEEGRNTCPWCKGKVESSVPCVDCSGTGSAPCLGCFGGRPRAWEVTAARLEDAESWEPCVAYYEEALRLTRIYHQDLRAEFLGEDRERKKLQSQHERVERDLGVRVKAARNAAEKALENQE